MSHNDFLIMIERHYNLTCYVLEYPIKVLHSFLEQKLLYLIDSNQDIYQFDLSQPNIYEKIEGERCFKLIKQIKDMMMRLSDKNELQVRCNEKMLFEDKNVQDINIVRTSNETLLGVILKREEMYGQKGEGLLMVLFKGGQQREIEACRYEMMENKQQQESFQTQEIHAFTIQAFYNHYCLCQTKQETYFLIKILFDSINFEAKTISYERIPFDFPKGLQIRSSFMDKMIGVEQNQVYLIDLQRQKTLQIKECSGREFIVYNNWLMVIDGDDLICWQTLKGNMMGRISISAILQEFQEGSSLLFNQEDLNIIPQQRFFFLYEELTPKISHFYLLDKEKIAIYYFNINKLIERTFIQQLKETLKPLEVDADNIHEKIIKTMAFRNKKIEALMKYINEDLKVNAFTNTLRFLMSEQNIFVLNDGLKLFHITIIHNFQALTRGAPQCQQLEREIIKICSRLIMESKYEDHIANALTVLNSIYTHFKALLLPVSTITQDHYEKLFRSKKILKLLKQDKIKKLFELSYELCIKIKGLKFIQQLQKS